MSNLGRRIERLEESLTPSSEQRVVVITNVNPDSAGSAYAAELFPGGPWAIWGKPFTEDELDGLRETYARDRR